MQSEVYSFFLAILSFSFRAAGRRPAHPGDCGRRRSLAVDAWGLSGFSAVTSHLITKGSPKLKTAG